MQNTSDRIFAEGVRVSNDTWLTRRNNNDLIIGPSGAGKTTGYVLPNILHSEESMIIVDTKGNLHHKTADHLRQKGYTVLLLDFTDIQNSPVGYNPLDFVRRDEMGEPNEQDIMAISHAILPDEAVSNDPFWSRISKLVLESAIAYILEYTSDTTLTSVSTLLAELTTGKFDRLLEEIGEIAPDSLCYRRYAMWRNMRQAEKMTASVAGILAEAMAVLSSRGAQRLYADPVRVDFHSVADHKTAVFLTVSDTDAAQYKLVNLFYTQALHTLCDYADRRPGSRLPIPVRLYLDDFASNLVIPAFDKIISVIRSREISVSIMLQSIAQLNAMYGEDRTKTIIGNCDHCLLLGCNDIDTARYFSIKANTSLHRMDDCFNDDGSLIEQAEDVIRIMDSYTEISPSGRGIRILFLASNFKYDKSKYYINNQKLKLECYIAGCTNKYVSLTGNAIHKVDLVESGDLLQIVLDKYMLRPQHSDPNVAAPAPQLSLDDSALLEKACSAANGDKFSALFSGDVSEYEGDDSAADMALCNMLAFWSGRNAEQMDRLFRLSGLMRDKWDRPTGGSTYGQITIGKAITETTQVYTPKPVNTVANDADKPTGSVTTSGVISAMELYNKEIPPVEYIVDTLLAVGTTILAAAPKLGKSWLVLLLGLCVAAGKPFLGYATHQCGVLYLALEDGLNRLKSRMIKLLDGAMPPDEFDFATEIPNIQKDMILLQADKFNGR